MDNKKKKRIELILSFTSLLLSAFIGFLILRSWGIIAGIAGAVIGFVIFALLIPTISKAVFHVALYENEDKNIEKKEMKKMTTKPKKIEKEETRKKRITKPKKGVTYKLTKTSLSNPLNIEVTTEKYCVYCKHLSDPNLREPGYSKGAGYCTKNNKGEMGLDDSCENWEQNTKVRYWLSKGYMENNIEGWPRKPWYPVFDDGPDGKKGTR
ncbi:hypothetical protein ACFLRW_03510 [Acidobacteriota bacterium]